ncbi:MAG: VOC family protein [Actinobacteria bacterium]|nr:VOC family protein [Actinomycetota bacterium]
MSDTTTVDEAPRLFAITLFVDDLERLRASYSVAFDAEVVNEDDDSVVFGFGPTLVNLLSRSAADELVAPWAVGAAATQARAVFTVAVTDTDAYCQRLGRVGILLINGPMTRPWGPRTASFADPDGHVWEIAS